MEDIKIRRALLSVTDKTGLPELAAFLSENGVELVSTGGTAKMLAGAGLPVVEASDVTGFPEILNGRVKTLHPKIHAGILASKDNREHMETLASLDIAAFDLVCVNLYDFSGALEKGLSASGIIEEIDIGGPCLLRAASKNFGSVLVLPSAACYAEAMRELRERGMRAGLALRQRMAAQAFGITARYDSLIASWLQSLAN